MEKLFLAIAIASLVNNVCADDLYKGPLGDKWNKIHTVTVKAPLNMDSSLVIKTDRLILESDIISNGFKLDIEAREIIVKNNSKIKSFNGPVAPIALIPPVPKNSGTQGCYACKPGGHSGDGGPGEDGKPGFRGLDGRNDPAPITVKTLSIEGELEVIGNGQNGGKGGKGGPGSKGGDGGNGQDGYAEVSKACERTRVDGKNGGNGGPGGFGGPGGDGGNAGVNVALEILLPKNNFYYESKIGLPGLGGDVGELGPSGKPGSAGSGDHANAGNCRDDATADPGIAGKQIVRKWPEGEIVRRTGKLGAEYQGPLAEVKIETIDELLDQKEKVIKEVYGFHFARLYQTLVQDTFRLLLNEEVSRQSILQLDEEMASILLQANDSLINEMISNWTRHFQKRISNIKDQDVVFYKKNADEVIALLTKLQKKEVAPNELKQLIQKTLDSAKLRMKVHFNYIFVQCRKLNQQMLSSKLSETFGLIHVPLCREETVKDLLQNPKKELALNVARKNDLISTQDFDSMVVVEETTVDQDRSMAQLADEVIILYNRTYHIADFKRAIPGVQDASKRSSLVSYEIPEEKEVTLSNLKAHLLSLSNGASVK